MFVCLAAQAAQKTVPGLARRDTRLVRTNCDFEIEPARKANDGSCDVFGAVGALP